MYDHFLSKFSEKRDPEDKVLSISHSVNLAKLLGYTDNQIIDASYPEYDMLELPFEDGEFDVVVSDQVLEHIEGDPVMAFDETYRVLKKGGMLVHTTCFINPIHGAPNDYWRFTPEALKYMAERFGEVMDVGGWGNIFVWFFFALGLRYEPIPENKWHPVQWLATFNQVRLPVTTWVIAKKR